MSGLTRRQWLGLIGLGPIGAWALALEGGTRHPSGRPARLIARWPTGNRHLAPPLVTHGLVIGAGDLSLFAIAPDQPLPLWQIAHAIPGGAVFRPRLAEQLIIVGGRAALGAWRLAEVQEQWRYRAHIEVGTPWVDTQNVCFGDGHLLICLDALDGRERWRFATTPETKISYAPVATEEDVYTGAGDGSLYALARGSGRLRWQIDGRGSWQYLRQIHLAGDLLIAGAYTERLVGLELKDGKTRWTFAAGNFINSHHVAEGRVYFWSPTGWLYALDAASGQLLWRLQTNDYRGSNDSWAAMVAELTSRAGLLFALDLNDELHVVDCKAGQELRRFRLPEPMQPFVVPLNEQAVICGTKGGDLLLLDIG